LEVAIAVEGPRQRPPGRCRKRRAGEVREVAEGDLRKAGWLVVRRRVEALEARALVVVPVRVMAVEDEVARDLDLVRRVVREVPGGGRVAQPDLEEDGRDEQHRADEPCEPDAHPARPGAKAP